MAAFQNRRSWYVGLSSYWFATSAKWYILLLAILPGQVAGLVPGGAKGRTWGMVVLIGALWAIVGPCIFGYFSDKLQQRGIERGKFLIAGGILTCIALLILWQAKSVAVIVAGYLLLQIGDDVGTGPYSAFIPDYVPEEHRGVASGAMGALQAAAQVFIAIFALKFGDLTSIYACLIVLQVLCVLWAYRTIQGAVPLPQVLAASENKQSFAQGWVEPWRDADFRWVWFTRFVNAFGFYLIVTYVQYFLVDKVKVFQLFGTTITDPSQATMVIGLAISISGVIGAWLASRMSSKYGHKRIVYVSGFIMASAVIPFVLGMPYQTMVLFAIVFGVGYGSYLSADWAVVSDVLPNKERAGQEMGVWQMSNSVVQVFSGRAGFIVDRGLYVPLFLVAGACFVASTVLINKVKGSR